MPDDFSPIAMKARYSTFSPVNNATVKAEKIFVQKRYVEKYKRDLFI